MSFENDTQLLREYEVWKLEFKYREKEPTPEVFMIERARNAAYDKLAEIDQALDFLNEQGRIEDYITKLEDFVNSVAKILERDKDK